MKIAKKFAGLLIGALLSSTSWGMEESKERKPVLPAVLVLKIFEYGDIGTLARSSVVCKEWNRLANTDRLWAFVARYHKADKFKNGECSWKQVVQNWATVGHLLDIGTWKEEELNYAISDEKFASLEKLLLEKIKQTIVKRMELRIVDSKGFLAAFLAYYVIDMDAVWYAAKAAATSTSARFGTWKATCDAVDDAVREVAWSAARDAVLKAVCNCSCYPASHAARNATSTDIAWKAGWYAAWNAVGKILGILELKGAASIGKAALRLSTLYVLAYASQDEHLDNYLKVFLAAKEKLDEMKFSKSVYEILAIIAAATWENEEKPALAKNPHIVVLKDIFEELARGLEERTLEEKVTRKNKVHPFVKTKISLN